MPDSSLTWKQKLFVVSLETSVKLTLRLSSLILFLKHQQRVTFVIFTLKAHRFVKKRAQVSRLRSGSLLGRNQYRTS